MAEPLVAVVCLDDCFLTQAADLSQDEALEAVGWRVYDLVHVHIVGRVLVAGQLVVPSSTDTVTIILTPDRAKALRQEP
jgi:hypothetical protein